MAATPTPLTRLTGPGVWVKHEHAHPSGSIKHRSIPPLVTELRRRGDLAPGQPLVIHSAGSAAIATAWIGARLGHPVIALVARSTAPGVEHKLRWLGATCERVRSAAVPQRIRELSEAGAHHLDQQRDDDLVDHYRAVVDEIAGQLPAVATIVIGIGTGASITGMAREVRDRGLACSVVGVEPAEARVAAGATWAPHGVPGLAPPFPQPLLEHTLLDQLLGVTSSRAWGRARELARSDGLLVCPASGAAVEAASTLAAASGPAPVVAVLTGTIEPLLNDDSQE